MPYLNKGMSAHLSRLLLPALTLVFGIEMLRVFLPYLQNLLAERLGIGGLQLPAIALAVFSAGFLAAVFRCLAGLRITLALTAGGAGLARLGVQFWHGDPLGDLVLVLVGTVLFFACLPLLLGVARLGAPQWRGQFAQGLLLGFAIDVALNGAFLTYDFIWLRGAGPVAVATLLVAVQWLALKNVLATLPRSGDRVGMLDARFLPSLPWVAIGMLLFLELMIFANVAHFAALTDWPYAAAFFWLLLCHVFGLWLITRKASFAHAWLPGFVLVSLPLFPWSGAPNAWLTAAVFLVGQSVVALSTHQIIRGSLAAPARPGLKRLNFVHGFSTVLLFVLVYAYYIAVSLPVPYQKEWLFGLAGAVITACALGASRTSARHAATSTETGRHARGIALALMVFPVWVLLGWQSPVTEKPDGSAVRIVDYNVHNGFGVNGQLDLEALAGVIEAEQPDIVTLQEVSRGWLLLGSVDMVTWLSRRLQMAYAFAPSSGPLWGHVVFSRYPILEFETHRLPPENLPLKRSFSHQLIDTGEAGPLHLVNTHFHSWRRPVDSDIRVAQAQSILDFLEERSVSRSIITGDLNATPETPEIGVLTARGFRDVVLATGRGPGYTYRSVNPDRKIDYILYSEGFLPDEVHIVREDVSDHFGMAATLRTAAGK